MNAAQFIPPRTRAELSSAAPGFAAMNELTPKDLRSLLWRIVTQQFSGDINGQSVTDGEINTNGKEVQTMTAESIDDAFPSKYLKASDLPEEGTLAATIEDVAIEEIGKNREKKPVIRFEELDKALVSNKTNCNTIAKITGSRRFKDWVGKTIQLYRAEVEFQGEMIESIRVRLKPDQGEVPF